MSICVKQLGGADSLLPPCWSQVLNLGHQAWWQVPLLAELSPWSPKPPSLLKAFLPLPCMQDHFILVRAKFTTPFYVYLFLFDLMRGLTVALNSWFFFLHLPSARPSSMCYLASQLPIRYFFLLSYLYKHSNCRYIVSLQTGPSQFSKPGF